MSLTSKSPRSSRHNSLTNLFGLGTSRNQGTDNELTHNLDSSDNHENAQFRELGNVTDHQGDHHRDNYHDDASYDDEYDEPNKSATYTQNHPMGRILLELISETNKGKKSKDQNIENLCHNFYEAMQIESLNKERQFKQLIKQVEDNLIKKELTSHTITMDIRPPSCYSQRPILTTMAQKNECYRLFPSRNKFGGSSKEHNMDVVEFLYSMNAAHEGCKLSKEEFKQMLLLCTTGKPNSLIRGWIASNYDIPTIYHYLQVHFDTRISPQAASDHLKTYKAPRSATLAKVQAHLMDLAERAASQVPEGPSRAAIFDLELNQALIRSLPAESQRLVQTKFNELSARQGRAASAAELSQALHSIRHVIDQDISKNGGDRSEKHRMHIREKVRPHSDRYAGKRPSAYIIQRTYVRPQNEDDYSDNEDNHNIESYYSNEEDSLYPQPRNTGKIKTVRTFKTFNTNLARPSSQQAPRKVREEKHVYANKQHDSSDNKHVNGPRVIKSNKVSQDRQVRLGYKSPGQYCSLCGRRNHLASQGCRLMVDDNGNRVNVLPTHSTCTECPPRIKPRLNHPMQLCPYRKGTGPLKHLA